ncbi:uncharacterized transposon-derived protein F54H12.3 [Trichonephila clavipes]|nr:uncharacterized transposon-derived protein F54H12.3 [Trichonephila clavipes]
MPLDLFLPTKDGITVTPSVWLALVREFSAIDQAFEDGKVFVIKDCLLLSRTVIENVTHIIMQRYFQRKDFTRKFLTPVSMLKETEWNVLKDIHKQITSKTVSIMFGRVFLKLLRQEVAKHIPFPKSDCVDCIDAEMVLTTSMVELLCNHIEENISSLFVCFGCLEGYENQLGHECMTYSNGQRISEYGDLAILNMDWDKLVADFVNRNIQMKMKVGFFTTNNKAKASIVERFNRTLKTKMWKYFTEMNTKCYIDVLEKLVYSYNHTWHRSIRMEPSSVSEGNQTQVWLTLYGQSLKESKSIFKVGDTVRISREKLNFEKRHLYPQELQKVSDSGFYPVEKVIRTRKRNGKSEYLVKFQGYPDKFNAWVSDVRMI